MIVVAAVIEENNHFLLTRRQPGVHLAGMWEFPGGKIGESETHAIALAREIREELDAGVEVGELAFHISHAYPDRAVELFFYRCRLVGTPCPMVGQEMRWVPRNELPSLSLPPADKGLIDLLVRRT